MIILNLVDESKSDIKYKISKFPDGQQNIIIENRKVLYYPIDTLEFSKVGIDSVQIKSRLNNWLDLELITCTVASLRELKVKEIHLYVPYILGARSDRKFEEGGNNYLKDVICPAINALGCETVTCLDPHSDVLEACIKGFRKESNLRLVEFAIENISGKRFDAPKFVSTEQTLFDIYQPILVSPDAGASKKIYKLAEQIGYKGDIVTCSKERDKDGKLTKTIVPAYDTGPLIMKDYIIIDDICDGGATFINIAKELKKLYNCNKIYLIVTHGIFSKGFEELKNYFDGIYCTNSYSNYNPYPNGFRNKHLMMDPKAKFYDNPDNFVKQLNIF